MAFVVQEFLVQARVSVKPVSADLHISALAAHARYGKGVSPARLNMGDCFSYAKQAGGALLYKGNDFAQTDLA
jgi:ribonuclease VapC